MQAFQTTPVFQVGDLQIAKRYYIDVLGFEEVFEWGEPAFYPGVRLGSVVIHLNASPSFADRCGKGSAYIFVEDGVQAYFDEVMARGALLVGEPPKAYDYGMIDVKFADPDGNWFSVGQECPAS